MAQNKTTATSEPVLAFINKLADIDIAVLLKLVDASTKAIKKMYPRQFDFILTCRHMFLKTFRYATLVALASLALHTQAQDVSLPISKNASNDRIICK